MKNKKFLAGLMCVMMVLGGGVGCSTKEIETAKKETVKNEKQTAKQEENTEGSSIEVKKEGFPIVDESITLKIVVSQTPVQQPFSEMVILKEFAEKSNIKIDWNCIPSEFVAEKTNLMMASQDIPDVFMKVNFSVSDLVKYGKQDVFLPLDPYIDEYGPNIKRAFEEWPDVEKGIRMPDGNIYSLPYISGATSISAGTRMFFNAEALEQVNKEIPKTLDEAYEVLRAFKTIDYNGNGKNDEIPLSSSEYGAIQSVFQGSFGLGNRGNSHTLADVGLATGELRFIPASDRYKELLQFMNKLYSEELIDQQIFNMELTDFIAKGEAGRLLSYVFVNHTIVGQQYSNYSTGMVKPFTGPYGDELWNNAGSSLLGRCAFVMTNKNKYPEATMRWIDHWYSDEGVRDYFMGVKDETYYIDENDEYQYTDFVMKNPEGVHFEQVLGKYVPWAGGNNPTIASSKYFKGGEMQPITKACADNLEPYFPEEIWPSFVWDEQYADEMATLMTDIQTYVTENRALFVTGKKSFDEWDKYISGFKGLKVDRFMEIYKETASRYSN